MKKFLKKFLISILSLMLVMDMVVLGLTWNLKSAITDLASSVVIEETRTEVTNELSKYVDMPKEELEAKLDEVIFENEKLKELTNNVYDAIIDAAAKGENVDVDFSDDFIGFIDSANSYLKDYDIELTEEEINELKTYAKSPELNREINETINEFRGETPQEVIDALKTFDFVTSLEFNACLIGGAVVILVLIALLKKSYYKWLVNYSVAGIVSGIFASFLIPVLFDIVMREAELNIKFGLEGFKTYGYIALATGVIALVLHNVLRVKLDKKALKEE